MPNHPQNTKNTNTLMKAFTDSAVPFSISSAVGMTTFLGHFGERL